MCPPYPGTDGPCERSRGTTLPSGAGRQSAAFVLARAPEASMERDERTCDGSVGGGSMSRRPSAPVFGVQHCAVEPPSPGWVTCGRGGGQKLPGTL